MSGNGNESDLIGANAWVDRPVGQHLYLKYISCVGDVSVTCRCASVAGVSIWPPHLEIHVALFAEGEVNIVE